MHTQFAMQFTAGFAGQLLMSNNVLCRRDRRRPRISAALGAVGIFSTSGAWQACRDHADSGRCVSVGIGASAWER